MKEAKTYLTEELKKKIKEKAKQKGLSLATYIRQVLIKDLQQTS